MMIGCLDRNTHKPLRYLGSEINSVKKINAPSSILLAYPDVYEIGMSHFGSRILYDAVNRRSPYAMERVYMPWKDVFQLIKKTGERLRSLESDKTFSEFDAVGFSIQNELSYTNILAMLDIGGMELRSENRKNAHPVIIAGGGAIYNPAPLLDFIDVFVIGEADELIIEIMDVLAKTNSRKERLKELSKLEGLYVPSEHGQDTKIVKRVISSLDKSPLICEHLVPHMELIHDRITYEIQRGCNRGCRFCHAGMIYRPVRQRSPESIIESIERDLSSSGYRDIGFLSLNACDYPPLQDLISFIVKNFQGKGVFVSLPSLRIESIQNDFLEVLAKLPKSGFTIAPEAGSPKLKKIINKNITEDELLNTAKDVVGMGWNHIKSYFMIGLPKEDDSDIEAIVDTAYKIQKNMPGSRKRLTISVSNFIPKPHTPFQWEEQLSINGFDDRINKLSRSIRGHNISLKWGDSKLSYIEGVLARGDRKVGELIFKVYQKGEVFTAWNSEFDFAKWESAMQELGMDKTNYMAERSLDTKLPWDNISSGIEKNWLKQERKKAYDLEATPDCTVGICSNCGVCQRLELTNIIHAELDKKNDKELIPVMDQEQEFLNKTEKKMRLRCFFKKTGKFKWMGHFELMNAVEKAVIREELPVCVSAGYNPRPLLSFSTPVSAGAESLVEIVDIFMFKEIDYSFFIESINKQIPEELSFYKIFKIDTGAKSINQDISGFAWHLELDRKKYKKDLDYYQELLLKAKKENGFLNITRKAKVKSIRIFDYIEEAKMSLSDDSLCLDFKTCFINEGTIKPAEFVDWIIKDAGTEIKRLIRTGVRINGVYVNN
jgi:radical SAM family uncharacterized protein/radical SAM-linked protein